ncbi:DUF6507 family protein [Microbacterium marinum]|uniref:DUF6507 family protein n=1 Tax=Microbacterium marinum TaxID=421115 RepID=UPI00384B1903
MGGWDISASGVVKVLEDVNVPAEALGTSLNGLSDTMSAAVTATQSGAISEAVQAYFEQVEGPRIQGMSGRIQASVEGVVNATTAYVEGDQTMAAEHQQAAIDQVYPPAPPTYRAPGSSMTAQAY